MQVMRNSVVQTCHDNVAFPLFTTKILSDSLVRKHIIRNIYHLLIKTQYYQKIIKRLHLQFKFKPNSVVGEALRSVARDAEN